MTVKLWLLAPLVLGQITLCTALAWNGDNFALITLAVTAGVLGVLAYISGEGWTRALAGWDRSNAGWEATTEWAMLADEILRDALTELAEYDEEAATIHGGRAYNATVAYVQKTEARRSKVA